VHATSFAPRYRDRFNGNMAHVSRTALRRLTDCNCRYYSPRLLRAFPTSRRTLHSSSSLRTDGVFRELTEQRVRTPWIEAFRKQQEEAKNPTAASEEPQVPKERELKPKRMQDSYSSVILPLAQDPWLLDTYLNASGHIRLGTIFMDLDALSGIIAYKHTDGDVTTVTASCDRIVINHPLNEICDLELSGKVTYATGRSSLEISMQVAKVPKKGEEIKKEDVLLHCTFTMVSLDPSTKK
jgi:acyl-coenzyme A thioesterase 9